MKKVISIVAALILALVLCACGECKHTTWNEATCTEPRTCAKCGLTEGEPLGHTWKAATCIAPKTCTVCGATEGELAEHTWADATCTEPKTCTVCGATEGEALGHKWEDATYSKPKTCVVCGETEGDPLPRPTAVNQNGFCVTAQEFVDMFEGVLRTSDNLDITNVNRKAKVAFYDDEDEASYEVVVNSDYNFIALYCVDSSGENVKPDDIFKEVEFGLVYNSNNWTEEMRQQLWDYAAVLTYLTSDMDDIDDIDEIFSQVLNSANNKATYGNMQMSLDIANDGDTVLVMLIVTTK